MSTPAHQFPTTTTGLPEAPAPEVVELAERERFELRIAPVASGSAARPCVCSPTTAPSRAGPEGRARLQEETWATLADRARLPDARSGRGENGELVRFQLRRATVS
jgi:hypothetical protein